MSSTDHAANHRCLVRYELGPQRSIGPFRLHRLDWYILDAGDLTHTGHSYARSLSRARIKAARTIMRLIGSTDYDVEEPKFRRRHRAARDERHRTVDARDKGTKQSRLDLRDGLDRHRPT